ncbi:MAG: hypothetical protein V7K55_18120 [Nostoc sp.]|uniref:hypothetical protein n=1 Tax=Nostoc sp. TaxID=1180 RepID=UPI002FF9BF2F
MTANQITVHPSTVSIPTPLYKLGQRVKWQVKENDKPASNESFFGIVTEQAYRIDCESSNWQYTMAITVAKVDSNDAHWYAGEYCFDLDEHHLTACENYEYYRKGGIDERIHRALKDAHKEKDKRRAFTAA